MEDVMRLLRPCGSIWHLLIAMAFMGYCGTAEASLITFTTSLTGAEEVPGPGDPDETGFASVIFDDVASTVDWNITVSNLAPITLDHIHSGSLGTAGPVVIDFMGALSGEGLAVDSALLSTILTSPEAFYVNVHTTEFPAGAVRGQLSAAVSVPVPEPAMVGLLAFGLALLMMIAWRQNVRGHHEINQPVERACNHRSRRPACDAPAC
jgi:hypothetical protein